VPARPGFRGGARGLGRFGCGRFGMRASRIRGASPAGGAAASTFGFTRGVQGGQVPENSLGDS